jgi:guanylate kinase
MCKVSMSPYTSLMSFPEYLNNHLENKEDLIKVTDIIYGLASHIEEQKKDLEGKNMTLLIIGGLSGAGKDSVVQGLIDKDNRFGWVRTCTTRERRPEETDENDTYIRLTEEAFQNALKDKDVIEWVEYAGNHYCSLTSVFSKAFEKYDIPILRIEPKGSRFYSELWRNKEGMFDKVNLIYVFVVPPSLETLRERLLNRSGDMQFVNKRMAQTEKDIPFVKDAEYIVINETGKLEAVVNDLAELIK